MAIAWGIDTGAWRTRAVQMEGSFRRSDVGPAREVPTLWDEGKPLSGPSLKTLAEDDQTYARGERVAAMPMEQGTLRLVKLPFAERNAIEKALPGEVEGAVPYDLEDMVLVSRIIDTAGASSRSLALLARQEAVASRLAELKSGGVDPKELCFDIDALAFYADRGTQIICDIGHQRTLLALCQNGTLIAGRVLPSASGAWTSAIAASGFDWSEAESYKHQATLEPHRIAERLEGRVSLSKEETEEETTNTNLSSQQLALEGAITSWLEEIRTQMIALEDLYECGIDEVLLAGAGSKLIGLSETMGSSLGVAVRPIAVPGGHGPAFALAVALGQVAVGAGRTSDLRIGDLAHHGESERLWSVIVYGSAAVGMAVAAGLVLFAIQIKDVWDRSADLDAQIAATARAVVPEIPDSTLQSSTTTLSIMQEATMEATRQLEALGPIAGGPPPTLERLKMISRSVPSPSEARIDVRELNMDDEKIVFKAETDSYETAANIEKTLKQERDFAAARKGEEKKVGETIQFTMTIPLGEAATEEEATTPDDAGKEG